MNAACIPCCCRVWSRGCVVDCSDVCLDCRDFAAASSFYRDSDDDDDDVRSIASAKSGYADVDAPVSFTRGGHCAVVVAQLL